MLGLLRGIHVLERLDRYNSLYKKPVTLMVSASEDATYSHNGQLSFAAASVEQNGKKLIGSILVEGFGEPGVNKGDMLMVQGKLYPTRGARQGVMRFAKIHLVERNKNIIDKTRRNFAAGVYTALPDPQASFGIGLLIGQRSALPMETRDSLKAVGLTHIVAVSGYNLTILARAMQHLFAKRSRYQAVVLALSMILLFAVMVGSSPSVMRASLVSLLGLAAWYYGKTIKPLLVIALSAAITAAVNPIYLWSDIGWYLSFLAFFGILVLAPAITKRLKHPPKLFTIVLIETSAAQIMTMPLILYIFGEISLIGILANVLVVPFVPLAMLLTFFSGLAGMFVSSISGLLAMPANFVLTYILSVASSISKWPHITMQRSLSLSSMLTIYVIIGFIIIVLSRYNRDKHGTIAGKKVS